MATFHDRTLAPKFQGRLLRGAGPCRVLTSDKTVAEVEAEPNHPDEIGLVAARTLHSRRALARAADHGVALLAALNLPQLVGPDFIPLDPATIGDALDVVIAHLDALDAPAEDLEETGDDEPWLGWAYMHPAGAVDIDGTLDIERDTADYEDDDPREETSLETAGRGFVRCGADDDEDGFDIEEQHDAEQTYEDGSEEEPYWWRFQRDDAVQVAARVVHG